MFGEGGAEDRSFSLWFLSRSYDFFLGFFKWVEGRKEVSFGFGFSFVG